MKITRFDSATCRTIAGEIETALAGIADKYGVRIAYKGGGFSPQSFKPRFEIAVVSADGQAETEEVRDFRINAGLYGLQPDDLGRTFMHLGKRYALSGLKRWSTKFPILAKRIEDGREFKFSGKAVTSATLEGRAP